MLSLIMAGSRTSAFADAVAITSTMQHIRTAHGIFSIGFSLSDSRIFTLFSESAKQREPANPEAYKDTSDDQDWDEPPHDVILPLDVASGRGWGLRRRR